ncbi:uncharacterized protein LOC128385937 [Panonychus citri]|uniref:uncharacterized protein LOC128385937 n=1 Tax=Panonychus citri TaxID=50023 RepID=UPI002306FA87|nr:uncharacterized protein LOC128385937 [Panonychus citri]
MPIKTHSWDKFIEEHKGRTESGCLCVICKKIRNARMEEKLNKFISEQQRKEAQRVEEQNRFQSTIFSLITQLQSSIQPTAPSEEAKSVKEKDSVKETSAKPTSKETPNYMERIMKIQEKLDTELRSSLKKLQKKTSVNVSEAPAKDQSPPPVVIKPITIKKGDCYIEDWGVFPKKKYNLIPDSYKNGFFSDEKYKIVLHMFTPGNSGWPEPEASFKRRKICISEKCSYMEDKRSHNMARHFEVYHPDEEEPVFLWVDLTQSQFDKRHQQWLMQKETHRASKTETKVIINKRLKSKKLGKGAKSKGLISESESSDGESDNSKTTSANKQKPKHQSEVKRSVEVEVSESDNATSEEDKEKDESQKRSEKQPCSTTEALENQAESEALCKSPESILIVTNKPYEKYPTLWAGDIASMPEPMRKAALIIQKSRGIKDTEASSSKPASSHPTNIVEKPTTTEESLTTQIEKIASTPEKRYPKVSDDASVVPTTENDQKGATEESLTSASSEAKQTSPQQKQKLSSKLIQENQKVKKQRRSKSQDDLQREIAEKQEILASIKKRLADAEQAKKNKKPAERQQTPITPDRPKPSIKGKELNLSEDSSSNGEASDGESDNSSTSGNDSGSGSDDESSDAASDEASTGGASNPASSEED